MAQKSTSKTAYYPKNSIQWKVTSQAILLTAFVIVILTTVAFFLSRTLLERSIRTQLTSVAAIAEDSLESVLHIHRERAALIAGQQDIRLMIKGSGDFPAIERFLTILQRDEPALQGITVYNKDKEFIASAGERLDLPQNAYLTPFHEPIVNKNGWSQYRVYTPVWETGGVRAGYIALQYNAQSTLQSLLAVAPSIGPSTEVVLVRRVGSGVELIHPSVDPLDRYILTLPSNDQLSLLKSLSGMESVTRADDYLGRDSLVAYRYLPTLGWGLAVQVERKEALQEVRRLAIAHSSIGTLLLVLAGALATILSNQVTSPMRLLASRVNGLRPGHWNIRRSIHTDDEVELLDRVVVDMADRLKKVYDSQKAVITERTNELNLQYELDRTILENIEYGVVTIDSRGYITGTNPAALLMLNVRKEDVINKVAADFILIRTHGGKPLEGKHPITQCLQSKAVQRGAVNAHFNLERNNDSMLPISYVANPLISDGVLMGAILTMQDVTEERRLDYLKSEFITLASHQLRTPLSAIRWYIELFTEEKSKLDKTERGYLKEMQESVSRMVSLLNSLLHAAKLESSNLEPEVQEVDVSAVLHDMVDDSQALVHESGLSIALNLPDQKIILQTDPTLLRIVLQNLLTNAIKYTPKNSQKPIQVSLEQLAKTIKFTVRDEGFGIPSEEQKRIFQRFFRAKNVKKHDTDGNGLGLYITHTIVERLGGTIDFESEEDKGTTFTVTLKR